MEFTTKEFKAFRNDIQEAVKEVEAKYGVQIHFGNISYTDVEFNLKTSVKKSDVNVEKINFEKLCRLYGFEAKHYLQRFTYEGKTYELVGFRTKARKNNTIIRDVNTSSEYSCSDEMVKMMLGGM